MRMILKKNKMKKCNFKKLLTIQNLYIFLLFFLIISIILGMVFYFIINGNDKIAINDNIRSYFTVPYSYNYMDRLLSTVCVNVFNICLIWVFGISIIGIGIVIFICFIETFCLGISISSMFNTFGFSGIFASLCYLLPSKFLYLITLFIVSCASSIFSYKVIQKLIMKKDVDLDIYMKKYFKVLIIILILGVIYSILEVFVSPLMIKLFTFLIK